MADGMKRPAPQRAQLSAQQIRDPPHHFFGGLIGKRKQKNAVGRNALLQKKGHAVDQGPRLARSRPRQHQGRSGWRCHRRVLLRIEFLGIINLKIDRRSEGLQHVLT